MNTTRSWQRRTAPLEYPYALPQVTDMWENFYDNDPQEHKEYE